MIKIISIIALLLFSIALFAVNSKQFSGKYQVSETLKIFGHGDSIIGEYAMEIIQTNDSIFKLININKCSDTIEALLRRDTLFIVNQTVEYQIGQNVYLDGYGCYNNQHLLFWIKQFDYRDYSNSVLTCIDEEEYKKNSFISNSKKWSVAIKNKYSVGWQYSAEYQFNGFTVLNGFIYYNLYENSFKNFHNYVNYKSLWRESGQKIYKRSLTGNEELVFDTSIETNDTLFCNENNYYVVDSIDEKEWGGKPRKHWYMTSNVSNNTYWIEDVGNAESISGYNTETSDTISEFICYEENNEQVYQNYEFDYCIIYRTSSPANENDESLIELFSTENGLLRVQLKSNINGEIFFYTLEGKQVLKKYLSGKENTICSPASGLLLYHFENKKGEVQTGKVLVK
jgi:hypothetical protein